MRSKEEVCGLVAGFAKSGLPRREYCAKHGVAIATWGAPTGNRSAPRSIVPLSVQRGTPSSPTTYAFKSRPFACIRGLISSRSFLCAHPRPPHRPRGPIPAQLCLPPPAGRDHGRRPPASAPRSRPRKLRRSGIRSGRLAAFKTTPLGNEPNNPLKTLGHPIRIRPRTQRPPAAPTPPPADI